MGLFGKKHKGNKLEISVKGMTCGHCEMRVVGALESIEGVGTAKADRKKETAVAYLDPESSVSASDLVDAVTQAGYEAAEAG